MRFAKKFFSLSGHPPDYILLWTTLALVVAGFLFLASASADLGKIWYNDTYYFLKSQFLKGLLPGLAGGLVAYFIYYRYWKKIIAYIFLANVVLLGLVFTPLGHTANGASRWLHLGGLSFQPSEFLKFTFVLYIASLLSSTRMRSATKGWKTYLIFLSVSGVVAALIFFQPATTMAVVVIGSGIIMYLFSGASWKQLGISAGVAGIILLGLIVVTPYRFHRVAPFWNETVGTVVPRLSIATGTTTDQYHLNQSLTAIGSGGFWGVGFGKSTSKYTVLPESMGDSIFAVIAEEEGFLGSTLVIFAFIVFIWRGTHIAFKTHDDFARLTMVGFVSVIGLQAIIHIAANSGALPFTGVPLPFISYGGTAMAVSLTMVGLIANISKYTTA